MSCNKRFLNATRCFISTLWASEKNNDVHLQHIGVTAEVAEEKRYLETSSGRTAIGPHAKIFQVNRCEQFRVFCTSAKSDKAVLFSCESKEKKWTRVWCRRENSLWFRLIKGSIRIAGRWVSFYPVTPLFKVCYMFISKYILCKWEEVPQNQALLASR